MASKPSLWISLSLLLLATFATAGEIRYSAAQVLAPAGGGAPTPRAVNASGQVVGYYGGPVGKRAFLWSGSSSIDLGDLGGPAARAEDINNQGEIVGYAYYSGTGGDLGAFIYAGGTMSPLGNGIQRVGQAFAINDDGVAVGTQSKNGCPIAVKITDTEVIDLGSLLPTAPYPDSYAYDINADGVVVGSSFVEPSDALSTVHAAIFEDGEVTDIGQLGSVSYSEALAINDAGAVVGFCWVEAIRGVQAFAYQNGKFKILGSINKKFPSSQAEDINNSGQIVGNCYDANNNETIPFLYENGKMIDLNTVLPLSDGITPGIARLRSVTGINDAGQIVGTCDWVGGTQESGAVILTPLQTAAVATVTFSPGTSTFKKTAKVKLDTTTRRARIHYTTDGSEPTESSPRYRGPVKIKATTTIKAKAFRAGLSPSPTFTAVYTLAP